MERTWDLLAARLKALRGKLTGGAAIQRSSLLRAISNIKQDCNECGCSGSGLTMDQVDNFLKKHENNAQASHK